MADKVIVTERGAVLAIKRIIEKHPEADFAGWQFDGPGAISVFGRARRRLLVEDGRLVRLDLSGMGLTGRLSIRDFPHLEELSIFGADLTSLQLINLPVLDAIALDRIFQDYLAEPFELDELPALSRFQANGCRLFNLDFLAP